MQLTRHEVAALTLALEVIDFFKRHANEKLVEMKLDVIVEPITLDFFTLNPQHREDVNQHLMKCIISMMMNVPVQEIIEEAHVYKLILAGHFLQVMHHLPLAEY